MFKWFRKHTPDGQEIPDPTPIEATLNAKRPLTIHEQIARFVKNPEAMALLQENGIDTFDEANDFGPEGEDDPDEFVSPYQTRGMVDDLEFAQTRLDEVERGIVQKMPEERLERATERLKDIRKRRAKVKHWSERLIETIEKISPANAGDKK